MTVIEVFGISYNKDCLYNVQFQVIWNLRVKKIGHLEDVQGLFVSWLMLSIITPLVSSCGWWIECQKYENFKGMIYSDRTCLKYGGTLTFLLKRTYYITGSNQWFTFWDALGMRDIFYRPCFFCTIAIEHILHLFTLCPMATYIHKFINAMSSSLACVFECLF